MSDTNHASCPDEAEIGDFLLSKVEDAARRHFIGQHLQTCDYCREAAKVISGFIHMGVKHRRRQFLKWCLPVCLVTVVGVATMFLTGWLGGRNLVIITMLCGLILTMFFSQGPAKSLDTTPGTLALCSLFGVFLIAFRMGFQSSRIYSTAAIITVSAVLSALATWFVAASVWKVLYRKSNGSDD